MALSTVFNTLEACAGSGLLGVGVKLAVPQARCLCYIEKEGYAAATLVARMENAALDHAPIWDNLETFRGRPWRGRVDCLIAGFPCQPASVAGRRQGTDDERWLWPYLHGIIRDMGCPLVFLENVPGLLTVNDGAACGEVFGDLARLGYQFAWDVFSAKAVGSSHLRRRLYILAYAGWTRELFQQKSLRWRKDSPATDTHGLALENSNSGERADLTPIKGTLQKQRLSLRPNGELGHSNDGGCAASGRENPRRQNTASASIELAEPASDRRVGAGGVSARRRRRNALDGESATVANAASGGRPRRRLPEGSRSEGSRAIIFDRRSPLMEIATGEGLPRRAHEPSGSHSFARFEYTGRELPYFPPSPGLADTRVVDSIRELYRDSPARAFQQYEAELRNTLRWVEVLEVAPALEPFIRGVADGLAHRVDQLRLCGNGVVPLVGGIAFHVLANRLGIDL